MQGRERADTKNGQLLSISNRVGIRDPDDLYIPVMLILD
jgi:hypothetical protein